MVNTLQISKQLQEAAIQHKEADAIAFQMGNLIESDLVSKQNLKETELRLKADIKQVALKIEEVRLSLQKEIEGTRANTILWVTGLLFAQAALVVTLLKFL